MDFKDFTPTQHQGLFVSKAPHEVFGYKYVARFQLNNKRYVKVLGYQNINDMSVQKAYELMDEYKKSLSSADSYIVPTKINVTHNTQNIIKKESLLNMKKENNTSETLSTSMKFLLGGYKDFDPLTLQEGIEKIYHNVEMKKYQIELIKLQKHIEKTNQKLIVLFEGRDASGKGGAIRRITRYMNSRHYRVVALGKPTDTQKNQWFFQRYIQHFPTGGEMLLFDRSWYNRAMVEPVFGFCTQTQYKIFMEDVVGFERDLIRQDIILVKLYFSVSKNMQLERFERRKTDPLRQWKLSEVDLQAQNLWEEFSEKKYEMLKRTHTKDSPWNILRSDDKHKARLEAIKVILNSVDYESKSTTLNFQLDQKYNISVEDELSSMKQNKDY